LEQKVCVVGLGYIGLPTALSLAANGAPVVGVDTNPVVLEELLAGRLPFDEEGLPELLKAARANIVFSKTCCECALYIVAVATPYLSDTKKIDISQVAGAVKDVLRCCHDNAVIVVESTMPPGTTEKCIRPLLDGSGKNVRIAHAPERVSPGRMLVELTENARVIGADDPKVAEEVRALYSTFCKGEIMLTGIRTAEMTKVVENTYRDISIAFANELAKICRQENIDVYNIIRLANMHPRVNILQPGPGVGGHCIPVDPWFLVGDYPALSPLIHEARKVNDSMPEFVLQRINYILREKCFAPSRVGLYGISYKEDVDDVRESPTLQLLKKVKSALGPDLPVFDPLTKPNLVANQYVSFDEFLAASDLVVIMTAHRHIRENAGKLTGKAVLDTRHCITLEEVYNL